MTTKIEIDPATQTIIDTFDEHAKKRFAELLGRTENAPLQATREISFCLGYKAGVIDLGAALREQSVVDISQRLIVAIDKVRETLAINEQRDIAFDAEYERLSKTGACDNAGGMEWERVKAEWIAVGRPTEITIEAFIRKQANLKEGSS